MTDDVPAGDQRLTCQTSACSHHQHLERNEISRPARSNEYSLVVTVFAATHESLLTHYQALALGTRHRFLAWPMEHGQAVGTLWIEQTKIGYIISGSMETEKWSFIVTKTYDLNLGQAGVCLTSPAPKMAIATVLQVSHNAHTGTAARCMIQCRSTIVPNGKIYKVHVLLKDCTPAPLQDNSY